MANQNGQLILQALQNFDEPVTVTKLVTHIADVANVKPDDVKESVQDTLNGGVRYGYVQRSNRKYYAKSVDLEEGAGDEGSSEPDSPKDAGDLVDRGGRRRRSRGGKSRSGRSGSRRRRRSRH